MMLLLFCKITMHVFLNALNTQHKNIKICSQRPSDFLFFSDLKMQINHNILDQWFSDFLLHTFLSGLRYYHSSLHPPKNTPMILVKTLFFVFIRTCNLNSGHPRKFKNLNLSCIYQFFLLKSTDL